MDFNFKSLQPLLLLPMAIALGYLFWRYRWCPGKDRGPQSSNLAEGNPSFDSKPTNAKIASKPYTTNDLNDLVTPEENVEHDRRTLSKYTWASYKTLPPAIQETVESAVLKDLLAVYGAISHDACSACLKDEPNVRALLLQGWEMGTFEALRRNSALLLLSNQPTIHCENANMMFQSSEEPIEGVTTTDNSVLSFPGEDSEFLETVRAQASTVEVDASGRDYGSNDKEDEDEGQDDGYFNPDDDDEDFSEDDEIDLRDHAAISIMFNRTKKVDIYGGEFIDTSGGNVYKVTIAGDLWQITSSSNDYHKAAEWYFNVDYRAMHNEIAKKRSKNTGGWFLQTATYGEWCTSPHQRLMWCPGIPGVGKTVMASLVVDHLRMLDKSRTFVGVIYFNYKLRSQQSKFAILEALCRQMFEICEHPSLKDLYDSHVKRKSRPTETELQSALSNAFKGYQRCYLILDALDEYTASYSDKHARELIAGILALGENVKLLVTSRVLGEMQATFKTLGANSEEIVATNNDLRAYLVERVASLKSNLDFEVSDELTENIVDKVIEATKGRFLVAELAMNLLAEKPSRGDLKDALNNLPNEIDDIYIRVMEHIKNYSDAHRELAMKSLMWVAYAHRRLSVRELQHALATRHDRKETHEYIIPLSTITSLCAGLIVVQDTERSFQSDDERIVRFVHFTTQEFFGGFQSKFFVDAHKAMFQTCADYLSNVGLHVLPAHFTWKGFTWSEHQKSLLPFYDYAALNWGLHAKKHSGSLRDEVLGFLRENDRPVELLWEYTLKLILLDQDDTTETGRWGVFLATVHGLADALSVFLDASDEVPFTEKQRAPIHMAAIAGQASSMNEVLQRSRSIHCLSDSGKLATHDAHVLFTVDMRDRHGRTPLSYATQHGHDSIVQLLLKHGGVQVDSKDKGGRTPLSYAAQWGRVSTVQLLLDHGNLDVNSRDQHGLTPLSHSARWGKGSVVELLLRHGGVEVDAQDSFGRTPLSYAAEKGETLTIKLLLDHRGVNADLKDKIGRTALSYAAWWGREQVVKLLLEYGGVEVNTKDKDGLTPFSHAAKQGEEATVKLLIEHGAVDVDSMDKNGLTAIWHAIQRDQVLIVKLLLERGGVRLDIRNNEGLALVSSAVQQGNESIINLLLRHVGVKVNLWKDHNGRTALSHAVNGKESILKLLLEQDFIDLDTKDDSGRTPFSYAVQGGRDSIIRLLLERAGVEVDSKDNHWRTPLSFAAQYGRDSAIRLLLAHGGIDVDLKDGSGRTALSYAAEEGHQSVVELLLEHGGVQVDSTDNEGRTPLLYAARRDQESVIELLLRHGSIAVNTRDTNGLTPFSYAVIRNKFSIIKLVLEHGGVEVDSADNDGRTPLLCAAENGFESTVKLLLKHGDIDVNAKEKNGRTPLSYAAQWGEHSIVKLLLEHGGVEVDSKDNDGRTPFAYATQLPPGVTTESSIDVLNLLLQSGGVDVNSQDKHGRTPLWYAGERGQNSIVDFLRMHGAIEAASGNMAAQ